MSEFIENGEVEVIFVKTLENDADIFTKNVSSSVNDRHFEGMMKLE